VSATQFAEFKEDLLRARDLVGLGQAIGAMTSGRVDATDLYRAALVQGVAAWDKYIHGIVLNRAVDILVGRAQSSKAAKIGLSLAAVAALLEAASPIERELTARSLIAERIAAETFQRPDDVAAALAMVGVKSVWKTAFPDPEQAKIDLGVIIDRRNKIVHQCDADMTLPGALFPLTDQDTVAALEIIDTTVSTVDPLCT